MKTDSPQAGPSRKRVLFLCTGNSARSQMAEAFLRRLAGGQFEVHSAGLNPREIHPLTRKAMHEVGIDISGQRSKGLDALRNVPGFLYLIIVCSSAEKDCPSTFAPSAIRMSWPFDDPSKAVGGPDEQLRAFRKVRDEIRHRIERWLREELPPSWAQTKGTRQ